MYLAYLLSQTLAPLPAIMRMLAKSDAVDMVLGHYCWTSALLMPSLTDCFLGMLKFITGLIDESGLGIPMGDDNFRFSMGGGRAGVWARDILALDP